MHVSLSVYIIQLSGTIFLPIAGQLDFGMIPKWDDNRENLNLHSKLVGTYQAKY